MDEESLSFSLANFTVLNLQQYVEITGGEKPKY